MKVLDADYSAVDLADHCNGLKHLDLKAKNILFNSLSKYPELFFTKLQIIKKRKNY
jgi:hypothetical protein